MIAVWILLGMALGSWITGKAKDKELNQVRALLGHLRVQAKYGSKPVSYISTVKTSIEDLGKAKDERELLRFLGYKG